jgi:hypothetical protein
VPPVQDVPLAPAPDTTVAAAPLTSDVAPFVDPGASPVLASVSGFDSVSFSFSDPAGGLGGFSGGLDGFV